jgi:hypothetical protein
MNKLSLDWQKVGFSTLLAAFLMLSCAKPGVKSENTADQSVLLPAGGEVVAARNVTSVSQSALDGALSKKGVLNVEITVPMVKSTVKGYFLGYEAKYILRQDTRYLDADKLRFKIVDIVPGIYELLIFGQQVGESAKVVATRVKLVTLAAGESKQISVAAFEPTTTLTGTVKLADAPDNAENTVVRIAGTHLQNVTDIKGEYQIKGVPRGRVRLEAVRSGYAQGVIDGVTLATEESYEMHQLILIKPTFSGTGSVIYPAIDPSRPKEIPLVFIAPEEAKWMRISEVVATDGAEWLPIQTTLNYQLVNSTAQSLYIQFAKDQKMPSAMFVQPIENK